MMSSNQTHSGAGGRGGRREGAGRKPGSLNKLARESREAALATGLLPHEILLQVARGEPIPHKRWNEAEGRFETYLHVAEFDTRMDAAKSAAPFYAPKISTVEVIAGLTDDDLDSIIAGAAGEAKVGVSFDREGEEAEAPRSSRSRLRASPPEQR